MKKLLIIALSVFISVPYIKIAPAHADNDVYLRVIDSETAFFSDDNGENLLFYLPYTYYVKVLSQGENLTHVECYGNGGTLLLDGYVPTSKLYSDEQDVTSPYLSKDLQTITTTVLYQDSKLTTSIQYVFENRTLKYYGELPSANGTKCFYVSYNNRLGYVKESDVSPFTIANHPNELTFLSTEEDISETTTLEQDESSASGIGSELKIIIIACLIIAGFIALAISLKGKGKGVENLEYYEETDCE